MQTQILLVAEEGANGIRHGANAQLETIAIVHQVRNVLADFLVFFRDARRLCLRQRLPRQQKSVNVCDMNKTLAKCARHIRVDLCNDRLCGFCSLPAVVTRQTDGHISALVRRRAGKCKHIYRQFTVAEHVRHIGKECRRIICAVFCDGLAGRTAYKQRIVTEMILHARL